MTAVIVISAKRTHAVGVADVIQFTRLAATLQVHPDPVGVPTIFTPVGMGSLTVVVPATAAGPRFCTWIVYVKLVHFTAVDPLAAVCASLFPAPVLTNFLSAS